MPAQAAQSVAYQSPGADLFAISTNPSISCEARLLYRIMTDMGWCKGRCWPSIETQALYLGRSVDSVMRYHRELEAAGLIIIDRSGRWNYYYPRTSQFTAELWRKNRKPSTRADESSSRTHAAYGDESSRTHAALTDKRTELKNVKNVPPQCEYETECPTENESQSETNANENVFESCALEQPQDQNPVDGNLDRVESPQNTEESAYALEGDETPPATPTTEGESVRASAKPRNEDDTTDDSTDAPTTQKSTVAHCNAPAVDVPHKTDLNTPARTNAHHEASNDRGKVFDTSLLKEIEEVTQDFHSTKKFIKTIRTVPESIIRIALSSLKIARYEQTIYNAGAYFTRTVDNIMEERRNGSETTSASQTQAADMQTSTQESVLCYHCPSPPQPERPEVTPEGMRAAAIFSCCHISRQLSKQEADKLLADPTLPLPRCVELHIAQKQAELAEREAARRTK